MENQGEPGIHPTVYQQPGGNVPTEATAARRVAVDRLEGETIIVQESRVQHLVGERVTLERATARHLEARSAQVDRSSIRHLEAERAVALRSAVGLLQAREVRASRSRIGLLQADALTIEQGVVGIAFVRQPAGPALLRLPFVALLTFLVGVLAGLVFGRWMKSERE